MSDIQFKDYYKTLGVERDADEDAIKKAYRRLARKYHPDVSKAADAQARMQDINEAYEVLRDKEKRAAYDQVGQRWQGGQEFQPPPGWNSGFEFSGAPGSAGGAGGFGDSAEHSAFFDALFGAAQRAGARRQHPHGASGIRGQDHHAKIVVPLEDSFAGATRELLLHNPEIDTEGRVAMRERKLQVSVPRGIRAGQQIRLTGQGSPGLGGAPAGDLYLEVEFAPHRLYRPDGRDLYLSLPVAPWEAALGATVKVPTPDGVLEVSVPPGSQSGRKLRLRGRGIPGVAAAAGDFYVVLDLVLPPAAGEKARAMYEQMARELAFNPRADLGV